jgi:hypothetical protein
MQASARDKDAVFRNTKEGKFRYIQDNSGGKISILEGYSIGHIVGMKIRMTMLLTLKGYRHKGKR